MTIDATPTPIKGFDDLITLFANNNIPHRVDRDSHVVEVATNLGAQQGVLYLRWDKTLPYLQLIHPMVVNVPADRIAEVEHAIVKTNNVIALPGFGYQPERSFVYFRLCVPVYPDEGVSATMLHRLISAVVSNTVDFLEAFRAVVQDGKPGDQIMELAVAVKAAASAATTVDPP